MAKVSLTNIVKRYDAQTTVIRGINLEVKDGEFIVFVGPSGCGKSTLLRMIAGLETITEGELTIGSRRANDIPPAQRGLAMVFQSYALYPHMTVFDNMAFALQLAGNDKHTVRAIVEQTADVLQIRHLLKRKPKELSGGQRQRVAIGRAIVRKPQVFLFDEPLSNLDASLRVQMRIELSRLHQDLKTTMIYVTHDQVEAMTLGQRIVVFNGGQIEQVGTPLELYDRPANLFVAGFLGSPKMNFINATVISADDQHVNVSVESGTSLNLVFDGTGLTAGASVTLGVRAEHITLREVNSSADCALTAAVDLVEHLGDSAIAYVKLTQNANAIAIKLPADNVSIKNGDSVMLQLSSTRCHLFRESGLACVRR